MGVNARNARSNFESCARSQQDRKASFREASATVMRQFYRWANFPIIGRETNAQKGSYGEIDMDIWATKREGWEKIDHGGQRTRYGDPIEKGIDGVYRDRDSGKYIIAEAKYGSSRLGMTAHGPQMSEKWIKNRLKKAVGEKRAEEILDHGYERRIYRVNELGAVKFFIVDDID